MATPRPSQSPFVTVGACPRCGGSSAHPFATGGVCLRCAGERVLMLDSGTPAAAPPAELAELIRGAGNLPLAIGRYEIIEEIGRGGMGCVYAARQPGLERIVALKVLPEGRGGAAGLELRFLREAQTSARLRHPHIVSVHDSGRADGFVFFSMDYIDGGDLARRLRERPFASRQAAALVQKLAAALAYTHAEGVLHRDVKPSNILLDGDEPRLADFGLAAQLEPGGDLTAVSGVLGTPHYVAPEALRGGSAALSAASDLYALGVVFYEMLTGRVPFAGASPVELLELIDQAEPPPLRLLAPAVPRDLETICLKCLEREPARRYAGAVELAEDLRRFLADEPILARTPGRLGALRKFSRRHRVGLTASGIVVLVLIGATIVSVAQAVRARAAEREAGTEAAKARALADFLENDLLSQAAAGTQPDRNVTLHAVLDRAGKRLDGRFTGQPLVEAEVHAVIGNVYDSLGDFEAGMGHLRRALDLRTRLLGPESPLTLAVLCELGSLLSDSGKFAEAEALLARGLELRRRVLGPTDPATLETVRIRAVNLRDFGRQAEADALLTATLASVRSVPTITPQSLMGVVGTLGSIRYAQARLPEAEALIREAAELQAKTLGPDNLEALTTVNDLALVYRDEGKIALAAELDERVLAARRRLLGPDHPHTIISMNNLAGVYKIQNRLPEAEALQVAAMETARRTIGPEHPRTLITMRNLADTYRLEKNLEKSAALMEETLVLSRRIVGNTHPNTLTCIAGLGDVYLSKGEPQKAEPLLREAVEVYAKAGAGSSRTAVARCQWGTALMRLGRLADAEPLLLGGYASLTSDRARLTTVQAKLLGELGQRIVEFYVAAGRPEEAAEWRQKLSATDAKK